MLLDRLETEEAGMKCLSELLRYPAPVSEELDVCSSPICRCRPVALLYHVMLVTQRNWRAGWRPANRLFDHRIMAIPSDYGRDTMYFWCLSASKDSQGLSGILVDESTRNILVDVVDV